MNTIKEFNSQTEERQQEIINGFKKATGYKTHIDCLSGEYFVDFENYAYARLVGR